MGTRQDRADLGLGRFWRRLVSAAAIYALVMQPLLLAVVGTQLANAAALDDLSLSQLCLHGTDGSPVAPADQSKYPAHNHCLLCFAGAFHLLDAPGPVTVRVSQPGIRQNTSIGAGAAPVFALAILGRASERPSAQRVMQCSLKLLSIGFHVS